LIAVDTSIKWNPDAGRFRLNRLARGEARNE
jgi:hypothetical protein